MRVRGLASALGGALAVAMVGACFQSLDGYAGPPEVADTGGPDVAVSSADVVSPDAVSPTDASDGATGPFCPTTLPAGTLFCEAFDGADAGLPVNQQRSSLSLVSSPFVSPPNAMRVDVDPLSGVSSVARLRRPFELVPSRIRVRADLKVDKCLGNTNAFTLFFALDGGRLGALALAVQPDAFRVVNQIAYPNGTDDFATLAPSSKRTWPTASFVHVELTWYDDFTADLSLDGTAVITRGKLLTTWGKGKVTLEFGNAYSNGDGDCHLVMDNVIVDGE